MMRAMAKLAVCLFLVAGSQVGAEGGAPEGPAGALREDRAPAQKPLRSRYSSGEELLQLCESDLDTKQSSCSGYVTAVLDTHEALVASRNLERGFCVPKGVDPVQLVRVAVKYLSEEPEKLHGGAAVLLLDYFAQAFPCE